MYNVSAYPIGEGRRQRRAYGEERDVGGEMWRRGRRVEESGQEGRGREGEKRVRKGR